MLKIMIATLLALIAVSVVATTKPLTLELDNTYPQSQFANGTIIAKYKPILDNNKIIAYLSGEAVKAIRLSCQTDLKFYNQKTVKLIIP